MDDAFGIYIHWPYCAAKCPYCDFNSHVARGVSEERYRDAILRELSFYREFAPAHRVTSVFFGGGTPSLMSARTVETVLGAIAGHWGIAPDAEITLEANPSSVEAGRFSDFRAAGVNRVSLGIQSLDDAQLRFLGRLHDVAEARAALGIAKAHFPRVSFDLIYARPAQTAAAWRTELTEALAMAEGHLSLYQLTIEPDTAFHRLHQAGKLHVPQSEEAAALYDLTQELCEAAGLRAYEVSNHARTGEESRHNLLYWRYGEYAGIGPGAHGRLVSGGARYALSALRDPAAWATAVERKGHGLELREALTRREEAEELLLMGLRLDEGVRLDRLAALTGYRIASEAIAEFAQAGLLEPPAGGQVLKATSEGRLVLNGLIAELAKGLSPVGSGSGWRATRPSSSASGLTGTA
jgi:putative oxygen-independent coproporphyrinogen III oxidase